MPALRSAAPHLSTFGRLTLPRAFGPVLIALLLLLLWTTPSASAQAATGTIRGTVTNGSLDNKPVPGQTVTLLPVSAAGPGERTTATSAEDGTFVFEGQSTANTQQYVAWVEYEGARYQVGPFQFDANSSEKTVDITIYEPTATDPGINIARNAIVLVPNPQQRQLGVIELFELVNPAKQAYIGKPAAANTANQRASAIFSLPDGAHDLQILSGIQVNALIQMPGGYADSLPVPPGTHQIVVQYFIDYEDNGLLFTKPFSYDTGEVDVLLVDGKWTLNADGFKPNGTVNEGGQTYQAYQGMNFKAGQPMRLVVTGAGLTTEQLGNRELIQWGIGGLIALVVVGGVGVPLLRRRRKPKIAGTLRPAPAVTAALAETAEHSIGAREDERQDLLDMIADLDDRHDAGEIGDDEWERLRAAKKAALIELIREARGI